MGRHMGYLAHGARRQAIFTLIELLVVIAIISVLISMLMPALKSAKDAAKGASCTGNFKQFGVAFESYSSDCSGFLPCLNSGPSWAAFTPKGWWGNLLANGGYMKVSLWGSSSYGEDYGACCVGAWRCPSFTDQMIKWGGGPAVIESSIHGFSYSSYPKPSTFTRPSQLLMMTDGWMGTVQQSQMALFCPFCVSWDSGSGGNWHEAAYVHMGGKGSNVLFYDSHVSTVKYVALKLNTGDIFGHTSR